MKKILLSILSIVFLFSFSYAQQWANGTINSIYNTNTGFVGIGTTTPTVALDVTGAIKSTTYIAGAMGVFTQITKDGFDNAAGDGYLSFRSNNIDNRMVIDPNGNVGIGTTSPISIFQVNSVSNMASIGDASGVNLNYGTSYIGFNAARNTGNWTSNGDGTHNGGGVVYGDVLGNMYFSIIPSTSGSAQNSTDLAVKNNIKMMISVADGSVRAKQINVQTTGWPDYVFKRNYLLPVLADLKTYVDRNHHLPEIPSEAEVAKDGINLGEMNKLLLKKVEELTLYLMEQQKQIEKLKLRVKDIEQKK